jgi:predicted TIM-barrel fold metal-dependent hydrolase
MESSSVHVIDMHNHIVAPLVIGSDYPLPAGPAHPVIEVKALALPPAAEAAILGENAGRLLRLTKN